MCPGGLMCNSPQYMIIIVMHFYNTIQDIVFSVLGLDQSHTQGQRVKDVKNTESDEPGSADDKAQNETENDSDEDIFNNINRKCEGCTYECHQVIIAKYREVAQEYQSLPVRIVLEADNNKDKNAIAFQVYLGGGGII